MKSKKVLFFGAGVLGSLYAARLHEGGMDVTVVARGKRYRDIREKGIVLEEFSSGRRTITKVEVVDEMPVDEFFDVCVVLLQRTHVEAALPILAKNQKIPAFLFMHNTVTGFDSLIEALGMDRVLIGHANAGGERKDDVVYYMISQSMTMGELDGKKSDRLKEIANAFKAGGIKVEFNQNMDAWKRYHMALGVPMTNAMYMSGSCNYKLSKDRQALEKFVKGTREAFEVLQTLGYPIEPKKMRQLAAMPDFLLLNLFKWVFGMKIMDIGGARHARNARVEMQKLSEEFLEMADRAGVKTPTLRELHEYSRHLDETDKAPSEHDT